MQAPPVSIQARDSITTWHGRDYPTHESFFPSLSGIKYIDPTSGVMSDPHSRAPWGVFYISHSDPEAVSIIVPPRPNAFYKDVIPCRMDIDLLCRDCFIQVVRFSSTPAEEDPSFLDTLG